MNITEREDNMLSASDTINEIIEKKNITKRTLAESINITEQNLYNKMKRDSFSGKELVEIGIKTGMKLVFIDKETGDQFDIQYNENELFKPKRKADTKTDEERKKIAMKSVETRKKNKKSD